MKTDLLLMPMSARWADMRAAALAAEEAGFDGLWTWDHLRDPDDDDGPGVLANMAATLQTISGGRLLLGLGAGGNRRTPYAVEQAAIGHRVEPDAVRAQRVVDAIDLIRRLWAGEKGFLRPDPPPPIVVGGFGPRMAAIAGRHGDGFNTQAFHPQLGELVRIAREEHAASGRPASRFVVTVFGGLEERWLRADSRARHLVERVGVDRLILLVGPPFDTSEIQRLGRLLAP